MKISTYRIGIVEIPLNIPFVTALRRVDTVTAVLLELKTDDGRTGYGSSAETRVITGDTLGGIIAAVKAIVEEIQGMDLFEFGRVFEAINSAMIGNSSAKATMDMAVHDLLAQAAGMPLYRYLGGTHKILKTDMTISLSDPQDMMGDSMDAFDAGFRYLKIKLGGKPNEDYARMAAIFKRIGNRVRYRIDANQGWKPKEAVWLIRELEELGVGIEMVEQPVHHLDFDGLKFVTDRVDIPILADESVFDFEQAQRIIQHRAADMINIKLMKTGGIHNAAMIARLAQMHHMPCMIGSMMESPVSIHAAIHFAMAHPIIQYYDLDVPSMYTPKDFKSKFKYGPKINASDAPGLGISAIVEDRVRWI